MQTQRAQTFFNGYEAHQSVTAIYQDNLIASKHLFDQLRQIGFGVVYVDFIGFRHGLRIASIKKRARRTLGVSPSVWLVLIGKDNTE